jgi:GTP-binding protein
MVPCDSNDIKAEYKILLNELKKFNAELLDKPRILAITKCDMIDDVMEKQMKKLLPRGIKHVFISSVGEKNIDELKDVIWDSINSKND